MYMTQKYKSKLLALISLDFIIEFQLASLNLYQFLR